MMPSSCNGVCPCCSGDRLSEPSPFCIRPLQWSALKVLKESSTLKLGASKDGLHFVAKLKEASLKDGAWVNSRSPALARKAIDTHAAEALALQLVAANVVETCTNTEKDKEGKEATVICV